MQEPSDGMIPVSDFAAGKGIAVEKAIEMIRDGFYSGRKIGESWYVEKSELSQEKSTLPTSSASKDSSKKMLVIVGLIVFAAAYIAFLAPKYQKDKVVGLLTAATDERKCFNFYKDSLKDPESAYLVDSYTWTKENEMEYASGTPDPVFKEYDAVLRVKIQAKNGFGAYGSLTVECPLKNGKFDRHYASVWQIENMYK